jgi:hypothetical protein
MSCDNKSRDEQAWMRTNGLSAHDWAVTTEYMNALKLLKIATNGAVSMAALRPLLRLC